MVTEFADHISADGKVDTGKNTRYRRVKAVFQLDGKWPPQTFAASDFYGLIAAQFDELEREFFN